MKVINIKMEDLYTGETVEREVDISVIYINGDVCWEVAQTKEKQEQLINEWISERANPQHETELELISFEINEKKVA